jgi:hypothetical protein
LNDNGGSSLRFAIGYVCSRTIDTAPVPSIDIPGGINLNHYGGTLARLRAEWANELIMPA